MIRKSDIIRQKQNFVLIENDAFFSEFDTYEIAVYKDQFHSFQFSKKFRGLTYMCLMTAEDIISMQGAEYFARLINCIQEETA
ncbi:MULTISPECIES: hypothetical protein [unclassified Sporosarcina]|uniref:hypothetical protein n=1 Tax=unclassified Sporosarcina TaxID=2647733 RepID=UPI00203EBCA5|nr:MULTISPECIES: hypothetical protein [unclassified Sporosarcina]GKV65471.1 hypothetical protein NCCP2331_16240 [Sporosarcina sp. NCCP-2331]GLB55595.1 hypothetical protein NCCP2378_13820 [Sporosarcina sp. NCCP-2378]